MDYFVLKGHELREPVPESRLADEFLRGALTVNDLARPANGYFWVPLRNLLPKEIIQSAASSPEEKHQPVSPRPSVPSLPIAPAHAQTHTVVHSPAPDPLPVRPAARGGLFTHAWINPVQTGAVCLVLACLIVGLAPWPALLYSPLLLAALVMGGMAMIRDRVGPGLVLCAGALIAAAALLWYSRVPDPLTARNGAPLPPVAAEEEEMPEASAQPASEAKAAKAPPAIQATPVAEARPSAPVRASAPIHLKPEIPAGEAEPEAKARPIPEAPAAVPESSSEPRAQEAVALPQRVGPAEAPSSHVNP